MTVPVITTAQPRTRRWGRLRGCWAVFVLLLSALDHLITAAIGSRPVAYIARRSASPIAAVWHAARRHPASTSLVVYVTSAAAERNHADASSSLYPPLGRRVQTTPAARKKAADVTSGTKVWP